MSRYLDTETSPCYNVVMEATVHFESKKYGIQALTIPAGVPSIDRVIRDYDIHITTIHMEDGSLNHEWFNSPASAVRSAKAMIREIRKAQRDY